MEILPIGIYGPYPAAGGATSCYLVRGETGNVVLDLGSGALSALMRRVDVADVDAFLLTHLHYDHFVDALALSYVPGRHVVYAPATPGRACGAAQKLQARSARYRGGLEPYRRGHDARSVAHAARRGVLRRACHGARQVVRVHVRHAALRKARGVLQGRGAGDSRLRVGRGHSAHDPRRRSGARKGVGRARDSHPHTALRARLARSCESGRRTDSGGRPHSHMTIDEKLPSVRSGVFVL